MSFQEVINKIISPAKTFADVLPSGSDVRLAQEEYAYFRMQSTQKAQVPDSPYLINVAGLPASGKSFYIKELLQSHPDAVYVSFDRVMESWSEYIAEEKEDNESAFTHWELAARVAGYELLAFCLERRYPVIFEHSNANEAHLALYKAIISAGYRVEIRYIDASPALVLPRLALRKRYFPPHQVELRGKLLQRLNPQYRQIVDRFETVTPWKENE